ncbi:hypothetical protein [Streptomyces sp. SA15]|uniref:hypothetical protein n=1 Tax=Streptomyces sp. SA15 TaxID=934019 RepID=UPI00117F1517|nr:hypothetical protein [Streptomyces sp. SA15]
MDEPTDPGPDRQTALPEPACPCGSAEHQPLRIGEKLSPSGGGIGGVYVCPAETTLGLRGVL